MGNIKSEWNNSDFETKFDFDKIYSIYYAQIITFVRKYLRHPDLAEDVTQEIFIKLWENHSRIKHPHLVKFYLFKIAKNHTVNILKKIAQSEHAVEIIRDNYSGDKNFTEDAVLEKEYFEWIDKALMKVSPRARQIFSLCREEGKTYGEVAAELGVSKNAIKHQMVNILRVLRNISENHLEIPIILFFFI